MSMYLFLHISAFIYIDMKFLLIMYQTLFCYRYDESIQEALQMDARVGMLENIFSLRCQKRNEEANRLEELFSQLIDVQSWFYLIFIPPATKLGGVYWNHPVRLSVCLSTRARLGKIARLGIGCRGGYFVPLGQPHSSLY